MLAIKREITVDEHHEIHLSVPELPVGATAEIIVLLTSTIPEEVPNLVDLLGQHTDLNNSGVEPKPKRSPHPDIAGKMQIMGDIVDTVPDHDWDLPK